MAYTVAGKEYAWSLDIASFSFKYLLKTRIFLVGTHHHAKQKHTHAHIQDVLKWKCVNVAIGMDDLFSRTSGASFKTAAKARVGRHKYRHIILHA